MPPFTLDLLRRDILNDAGSFIVLRLDYNWDSTDIYFFVNSSFRLEMTPLIKPEQTAKLKLNPRDTSK
jgi:hypothetical protein